jgi:AcrR family transcriptional regulator
MRRSHVVYYFPTMDDLLIEVLKMLLAVGQDISVAHLSGVKSPSAMLEAYVEATFLWFKLYPHHAGALFLFCHLAAVKKEYNTLLQVMRASSESRIAEILSHTNQGKKRPPLWVESRAYDIRSLMMGNLLNYFTAQPKVSYAALEQRTIAAVLALAKAS